MQREGEGKRARDRGRERGRREGQPILTPPLAPCTAILYSPNPLSLTPQDANSWSAAQIPKFQIHPNRRRNNNSQIHTHAPPFSYPMPPLTGPTTHLVSFKLNPRKSPKLSHPFLPLFSPFTPHLSIFSSSILSSFFLSSIKQLKLLLSSNLTCRIFIVRERELNGMWTKIRECRREELCGDLVGKFVSVFHRH